MEWTIRGLHHVTATVAEARPDLAFWSTTLGMRLVKKTVNFDNHHVFHFYYGDETGSPGSLMTTFPYAGTGVRQGVPGSGQVTETSLSVPEPSLPFWLQRLAAHGLEAEEGATASGLPALRVRDPSGLLVRLVGAPDGRRPWQAAGVPRDAAVRGLFSVALTVRDPAATVAFLEAVMGFQLVDGRPGVSRMAVGDGGAGRSLEVLRASAETPQGVNGLGTVHHVAFAVGSPEEQLALRRSLIEGGVRVTEVRDRQYFRSIYFREPGGVLYEVTTEGPGFAVDEPVASLGEALKLPPWEEPHRAEIERHLPPLGHSTDGSGG